MAEDLPKITFNVSTEMSNRILQAQGALDVSRSDYIRACIRIAEPLLLSRPDLKSYDDKRLADLGKHVCKIIGILEEYTG